MHIPSPVVLSIPQISSNLEMKEVLAGDSSIIYPALVEA
jgi:hypothetical protein